MAYVTVEIPVNISSPPIDSECTFYYLVQWKLASEVGYQSNTQTTNPIVLTPLIDGTTYNVKVTRYCCDGAVSGVAETTVNT